MRQGAVRESMKPSEHAEVAPSFVHRWLYGWADAKPKLGLERPAFFDACSPFLWELIQEEYKDALEGADWRSGDVVVDVGANIGTFAVCVREYATQVAGQPCPRVIAVEPTPEAEKLRALTESMPELTVVQCAAGASDDGEPLALTYYPTMSVMSSSEEEASGRVLLSLSFLKWREFSGRLLGKRLHPALRLFWVPLAATLAVWTLPLFLLYGVVAALRAGKSETIEVSVRTVSTLLDEHLGDPSGAPSLFLKVDVEGAEQAVLAGVDARWWPKVRHAMIEVHDISGRFDQICATLRDAGLTEQRETSDEEFRASGAIRLVFARRPDTDR
jgi:hypothetical protein